MDPGTLFITSNLAPMKDKALLSTKRNRALVSRFMATSATGEQIEPLSSLSLHFELVLSTI